MSREIKEGEKWALTWRDGDSEDGFELTKPRGGLDDLSNTPPQVRFLAAISVLIREPDFVKAVMEWFNEDYGNWEKTHKARAN